MKIILATNNQNKVLEFKQLINRPVYSLQDLELEIEIIEDGETLYDNALKKATAISKLFPNDIVISDDTGLFVKSLNGEPGVYSARYANNSKLSNSELLLHNLANITDRSAYFETVVIVYCNGEYFDFTGRCNGSIATSFIGENGFGYDSVFISDELNLTFAQMTKAQKNRISHRSIAINKAISSGIIK